MAIHVNRIKFDSELQKIFKNNLIKRKKRVVRFESDEILNDFFEEVKNIDCTTASKVGGAIGTVAGATIGSFIAGPVGFLVGGLIGGIGGGIAGYSLGKWFAHFLSTIIPPNFILKVKKVWNLFWLRPHSLELKLLPA